MRLYLEIIVNERPTGHVAAVTLRGTDLHLLASDLAAAGVPTAASPRTLVTVRDIQGLEARYDSHTQRLYLQVPAAWLPVQSIGDERTAAAAESLTSLGLVLNYDAHFTGAERRGSFSAWTEQRLFGHWGALSNTGVVRGVGTNGRGIGRSLRYETRWSYIDESRVTTYAAGDVVAGALPWSNAVRLAGLTIERNFAVRPDIVTYPVPAFAGEAAVPSVVDLFINGSRVLHQEQVAPGPFVIAGMPVISGSGTAKVVTTDVLGRQVEKTVSFYVANDLLRRGFVEYSLSGGWLRRKFGVSSWDYGTPAASGIVRYGLTDAVTIAGQAQGNADLAAGGFGADIRLGVLGVIGGAVARGGTEGSSGLQYLAAYQYAARRFSVNVRRLQRDHAFHDLAATESSAGERSSALARQTDQVTLAVSPGAVGGTFGAAYVSLTSASGDRQQVLNASYSRSVRWGTSLYVSASRNLTERQSSLQVQLVVPMGRRGSITASAVQTNDRETGGRLQYSRHAPPGGGLGWNVGYSPADDTARHADLTWRNRFSELRGGFSERNGQFTQWAGLSGSLVMMGGELLPTHRVDDAFVLVDVDGQSGVPVLFENQIVGRTNRRGRLLVPWVSSYYPSKVAIDPLALPSGVRVPIVEQYRPVRHQSGGVIHFPAIATAGALITLVDRDGAPLPLGSRVVAETGETSQVGWGGQVYFENLGSSNRLRVMHPDGAACDVSFIWESRAGETARLGPFECR